MGPATVLPSAQRRFAVRGGGPHRSTGQVGVAGRSAHAPALHQASLPWHGSTRHFTGLGQRPGSGWHTERASQLQPAQ